MTLNSVDRNADRLPDAHRWQLATLHSAIRMSQTNRPALCEFWYSKVSFLHDAMLA